MDFRIKPLISGLSELQRKTLISAIAAGLTVPYAFAWLKTSDADENLAISVSAAYGIIAAVTVYVALRLASGFQVKERYLPLINVACVATDVLIVAYVITITGGEHSVFFNLWWATVVSATVFFGIKGTLASSAAVAAIYPLACLAAQRLYGSFFNLSSSLSRVYPFALVSLMLGFMVHEERRQRQARLAAEQSLWHAERERRLLKDRLAVAGLTRREAEILEFIRKGVDNRQIGERLFITKSTVDKHVRCILAKLEVENRTQAAVKAERAAAGDDVLRRQNQEEKREAAPRPSYFHRDRKEILFRFFFIYRWVMLLFALFMILNHSYDRVNYPLALGAWLGVFIYTLMISWRRSRILGLLEGNPRLVTLDVVIGALLILIGGGWQNVFFAYFMAPVFVAVIYFGLKGGMLAAAAGSVAMLASMWLAGNSLEGVTAPGSLNPFIATVGSFYLVAYFSSLPARLIEHMAGRQSLNSLFLDSLTEKKREIALQVAQGLSNKEIAAKLFVSENTVKKHVREIIQKHGLKSRSEIAALVGRRENLDASEGSAEPVNEDC